MFLREPAGAAERARREAASVEQRGRALQQIRNKQIIPPLLTEWVTRLRATTSLPLNSCRTQSCDLPDGHLGNALSTGLLGRNPLVRHILPTSPSYSAPGSCSSLSPFKDLSLLAERPEKTRHLLKLDCSHSFDQGSVIRFYTSTFKPGFLPRLS